MQAAFAEPDDAPETVRESAETARRHFDSALDGEPLHPQANEGVQVLRDHTGCFGIDQ